MRQGLLGGRLTVGLLVMMLLHPLAASACPACFSAASEQSRLAYYWTAALMTLLPLAIVTTIGGWLYLRRRSAGRPALAEALPVSEVTR